jgi:hypothetical protein
MRAAVICALPVCTIILWVTPLGLRHRFRHEIERVIIIIHAELGQLGLRRRLRLIVGVICCPSHLV